jgi:succinyl-diaminopimelate desuccinylase
LGQSTEHLISILQRLIACPSISPDDANCQTIMLDFLQNLGFRCQRFDAPPVANFYAEYGQGEHLFVFAGHTDVVPTGELTLWNSDPFQLHVQNDMAYGRGVADMKGSLAAMLVAAQRWVEASPNSGRLGFLITSGEEGDDYLMGTPYVMERLQEQGIKIQYCIVGEPSSTQRIGDVIKIGRRGSLTGKLKISGKQGHVAYPHLARNPIHMAAPALAELSHMVWDQGTDHFPPTSLQITHVQAGGQATNIIPQDLHIHFNIRFSPIHTEETLKAKILDCFSRHHVQPDITWILSGNPFLTQTGQLLAVTQATIQKHTQQAPECSTSGGTSDGRFIAPYGIEVLELGPVNQTIHQINESVSVSDLVTLSNIYYDIICKLI